MFVSDHGIQSLCTLFALTKAKRALALAFLNNIVIVI